MLAVTDSTQVRETMSHRMYNNTCEVCGKLFTSKRYDAKTCGAACRARKSRGIKSGRGTNWYAVRPEYREMAQAIARNVQPETMDELAHVLYDFGAVAAEWAIAACWHAMADYKFKVGEQS